MTVPGPTHIQALIAALASLDTGRLTGWGRILADRHTAGARLLVAGNGGSAAEAQHLTSELVGRFRTEREPISAIALHTDTSAVTAIANDYGPEEVFARQVRAHGRPGDTLLLLSTSGASRNLLAAARAGREIGLSIWALTGPGPNPLAELVDQAICVAATDVATVQEATLVAVHLLCAAVDTHLAPPATPTGARAHEIRRLVIVGDTHLDRDITGRADRLSPEAPVPVVSGAEATDRPGGAGLAALLAARESAWQTTLICALGHDAPGIRTRALLEEAGIEILDIATSGETPVKTRVRASDRTLLRFDTDPAALPLGPLTNAIRARLHEAAAVLVCDYGRGITAHEQLRTALTTAAGRGPLVWDPHPKGTVPVPGTALAVPNQDEAAHFTTNASHHGLKADTDRATELLTAWPAKQIAVTRGRDGAVLAADTEGHPLVIPARHAAGDTCGAGDQLAVIAAMTLGAGGLPSHAVTAGVEAATNYVRADGPASLTSSPPDKERTDPLAFAAHVRARGARVVAAGGCFDLLHPGHLSLLHHARLLGDALIVCINSDASVRRLKGENRPAVHQQERAALLAALDCVDGVLIFEEDTPEKILAELRPDIWVKGGDYTGVRIPETDLVESWGGTVVTVPCLDGHSTTQRISQLVRQAGAR